MSFEAFMKIDGLDSLKKRLEDYGPLVHERAVEVIAEGALAIHSTAIKSIQAQGSGQTETRYNPTRSVRVSSPLHPPNSDTGRLVQSIEFDIDKQNAQARVGTNLDYGAWLEFGTLLMVPRPWLAPAFDKHQAQITANLRKVFKP